MGFRADTLRAVIDRIGNANANGEYYLTDAVELANADGRRVDYVEADADRTHRCRRPFQAREGRSDVSGLPPQPSSCRPASRSRIRRPVYFSWDTEIGRDVTIFPNVVFGPGVKIADNVEIRAFCDIEDAVIGEGATIGPFARIRCGAELGADVHLGNFVEVKKSKIGAGTKAGHQSYLGDAEIGSKTNIGAGTSNT